MDNLYHSAIIAIKYAESVLTFDKIRNFKNTPATWEEREAMCWAR